MPQLFDNLEPLMTYSEAAVYLRTTERTLRRYVAAKKIPFRRRGRAVLFDRSELDAWLKKEALRR